MALEYRFFINPFLSVTRNSFKKALSIGVDHKAKLVFRQADPAIAALLLTYNPVLDAYLTVDSNLNALLGGYKSKTQTLEELFEVLTSEKLPYWEGQVFYFFPSGTTGATDIFPNKRKPFNEGTYEQRIQAIRTLGEKCALTPSLGPVAANIVAFHTQIESARLMQQSEGEAAVTAQRSLRESARILLCRELYGNMGILMHKHRDNPVLVGDYYDMELLSRAGVESNLTSEGTAPGGITEVNADFGEPVTITATTKLKITHLGENAQVLSFYLSDVNNQPPMPPQVLILEPGDSKTVTMSQLGFPKAFFLVQNNSPIPAQYRIEIVEE